MASYDPADFNIDQLKRRLERAGTNVSTASWREEIDIYVVDFFMHKSSGQEIFPSSIELDSEGAVWSAQIRLPTFTVRPEREGLDSEEHMNRQRSLTRDKWREMIEDIGEMIEEVTGAPFEYGVIQQPGYKIRAAHGEDGTVITPHIEFFRENIDETAVPIDDFVQVVRNLNEMWAEEYFDLTILERSNQ